MRGIISQKSCINTSTFLLKKATLTITAPAQSDELSDEERPGRPVVVIDWDEMMKEQAKKGEGERGRAERMRQRPYGHNDLLFL